jgi:hypothetical protein
MLTTDGGCIDFSAYNIDTELPVGSTAGPKSSKSAKGKSTAAICTFRGSIVFRLDRAMLEAIRS